MLVLSLMFPVSIAPQHRPLEFPPTCSAPHTIFVVDGGLSLTNRFEPPALGELWRVITLCKDFHWLGASGRHIQRPYAQTVAGKALCDSCPSGFGDRDDEKRAAKRRFANHVCSGRFGKKLWRVFCKKPFCFQQAQGILSPLRLPIPPRPLWSQDSCSDHDTT